MEQDFPRGTLEPKAGCWGDELPSAPTWIFYFDVRYSPKGLKWQNKSTLAFWNKIEISYSIGILIGNFLKHVL